MACARNAVNQPEMKNHRHDTQHLIGRIFLKRHNSDMCHLIDLDRFANANLFCGFSLGKSGYVYSKTISQRTNEVGKYVCL